MKPDNLDRHEQVLRTAASLRWATVLLIATLATGLQQARAGINEWTPLGDLMAGPSTIGKVAGATQIDLRIPDSIQTGSAVPVVLQVGNTSSQAGVTIAVR